MGYARNRPKLLPEKLRLIREHLQLDHSDMAEQLTSEIKSHIKKPIQIKTHWVPNFELGNHEPDLMAVHSYGRLAKVSMELIVDDAISVETLRKRLRKTLKDKKSVANIQRKRRRHDNPCTDSTSHQHDSRIAQSVQFMESVQRLPSRPC